MIKGDMSISVFGSTGSVGMQALDVARFRGTGVDALCAMKNIKLLEEQIREFRPRFCAVADPLAAKELRDRIGDTDTVVYSGKEGVEELAGIVESDILLNSIVGVAGLRTTLARVKTGRTLALANKESLVAAGELVMKTARENNTQILPVDSEHCAIFQCLRAGRESEIKRIILTASGGPFFGKSADELKNACAAQALAHPTWSMGSKITVDCATLMNKGFEVIEAAHLFGVPASDIDVVVHRESIIHSMVEYVDNAVIAQMSKPDMRMCVQYALTYPEREAGQTAPIDFASLGSLSFYSPDKQTFKLLPLAYKAFDMGGDAGAALNAANEAAVGYFLCDKISFSDISDIVCDTVNNYKSKDYSSAEQIEETDFEIRQTVCDMIKL